MQQTILVAGTHGWRNDGTVQWFSPGSPFASFLAANGAHPFFAPGPLPFIWSTDLGGVGVGDGDLVVWAGAGANLYWFCVPPVAPQRRIPGAELNIIAHSHGLQVVLYAASFGLKINHLISVCSPVRQDVMGVAKKARPNIAHWRHLHSDRSDWWQWFGSLFDGDLRLPRAHPLADVNETIPAVGHTGLLDKPDYFHYWVDKGWIGDLR